METCESPKRYKRLKQGPHEFRVRARKAGAVDSSPAVRTFTVDSVAPDATILTGPTGVTEDHNPGFTFSSTEPGSFESRLGTPAFVSCSSPFATSSPLPDDSYTFEVRATDAAGNTDSTSASRAFNIETPLTKTLETAAAAAKLYFPDAVALDVPASCGGSTPVDCPAGTPLPRADQLSVTSTRSVIEAVNQSRYDVTVTSGIATLQPFKVNFPSVGTCDASLNSAPGSAPTWTVNAPLNFILDANSGAYRIQVGTLTVSGVESTDVTLSGSFSCSLASVGTGFFVNIYAATLDAYLDQVGNPMCAAPGPAYLGPCPAP
jgi:hypothetical protein